MTVSGYEVSGFGFRFGFRVWFPVQGSGFKAQGSGFRVSGLGFRVQDKGFRVEG